MFEIPYYVWARRKEIIKKVLWFLFLIKLYEKGLFREQKFGISYYENQWGKYE